MFRISYFVRDEDLVEAIHLVTPIAINLAVTAAPNGEDMLVPPSVLLRRKKPQGVKSVDHLMHALKQRNLKSFKGSAFYEVVSQAGLNPVSCNHYLKEMVKAGYLSKLGKGFNTTYQVIGDRA